MMTSLETVFQNLKHLFKVTNRDSISMMNIVAISENLLDRQMLLVLKKMKKSLQNLHLQMKNRKKKRKQEDRFSNDQVLLELMKMETNLKKTSMTNLPIVVLLSIPLDSTAQVGFPKNCSFTHSDIEISYLVDYYD